MSASLCLSGCGFFGSEKLQGFCSSCYRLIYSDIAFAQSPPQSSEFLNSPFQANSFQQDPNLLEDDSKIAQSSDNVAPNVCIEVSCNFFGTPEREGYCSTCYEAMQEQECEKKGEELGQKLVVACREGNMMQIVKLIANGANVNAEEPTDNNEDGRWFPLQVACAEGRIGVVKLLLLTKNIDVNKRGYLRSYAIHSAIQNNHFLTARALVKECTSLKYKLDLNKRGYLGYTPIDMCCNAVAGLLRDEEDGVKDVDGNIDKICSLIRFLVNHGAQKKCLDEFKGVLLRAFICDTPSES